MKVEKRQSMKKMKTNEKNEKKKKKEKESRKKIVNESRKRTVMIKILNYI